MKLKVRTDFARAPGPRFIEEGDHSGEEFRMKVLAPSLSKAVEQDEKLYVDLDGTAGIGTSFLEESFGGLIRHNGFELATLKKFLHLKSDEEPWLLDEINDYMEDAEKERLSKK